MNFVKEKKKPLRAIKATSKDKKLSRQYIITSSSYLHSREAFRKLHMQFEVVKLMSYLSGIYLESCFYRFGGGVKKH